MMATPTDYLELTVLPRIAATLPAVLPPPEDFDAADPATWPIVEGRLEYVQEKLLYMPPCGDQQQRTPADVVTELNLWRRQHPEFAVGANEAGMMLGGDVRGADAAIWRSESLGAPKPGFPRVPPILAVEVAGKDETPALLLDKAVWYLERGVQVVWVLVPASLSVLVKTADGVCEIGPGSRLPEHPALPGLAPGVDDLFRQVAGELPR